MSIPPSVCPRHLTFNGQSQSEPLAFAHLAQSLLELFGFAFARELGAARLALGEVTQLVQLGSLPRALLGVLGEREVAGTVRARLCRNTAQHTVREPQRPKPDVDGARRRVLERVMLPNAPVTRQRLSLRALIR